jgi:hypothetical protein
MEPASVATASVNLESTGEKISSDGTGSSRISSDGTGSSRITLGASQIHTRACIVEPNELPYTQPTDLSKIEFTHLPELLEFKTIKVGEKDVSLYRGEHRAIVPTIAASFTFNKDEALDYGMMSWKTNITRYFELKLKRNIKLLSLKFPTRYWIWNQVLGPYK